MRRGSTSRSQTSTGSARPCSGTSTSRRRSIARARGGMAVDTLPARQERAQLALVGGLDLLAQDGQRRAAQPAQHLGVAPLALACRRVAARRGRAIPRAPARPAPPSSPRGSARATSAVVNGPCVRAQRARTLPRAPGTSAVNASGSPPGGTAPSASRYSPASSAAIQRSSPAEAQAHGAALAPRARAASPSASRPSSTRSPASARGQVADAAQHVGERVARLGARALGAVLQVGLDLRRARRRRSGRAAPPGRAARAAGRGRATAPPRGAPRWACRPRTCTSRRSRTAARRRTARRSASRPRRATARAVQAAEQRRRGPGRRGRRAGTRGRSRG